MGSTAGRGVIGGGGMGGKRDEAVLGKPEREEEGCRRG